MRLAVSVRCMPFAYLTAPKISHDADRAHVLASVVKVPIGLEFYAQAHDGRLDPTQAMTLQPELRTPGPVGTSQFADPITMSLRRPQLSDVDHQR